MESRKAQSNILSQILPTEIPKQLIDQIQVTFKGGETVAFNTENIKESFSMEDIKDFLKKHDVKGHVELIEICIDVDHLYEQITQESGDILSKYFEDQFKIKHLHP